MRALTKAENIETDSNVLKKNGTLLADAIEKLLKDLKGRKLLFKLKKNGRQIQLVIVLHKGDYTVISHFIHE
jgi:hypothetical protein